jgi:hypothetical protein
MTTLYKHVAEWSDANGGRRRHRRPPARRETWAPRAMTMYAAAARFVERATRRQPR